MYASTRLIIAFSVIQSEKSGWGRQHLDMIFLNFFDVFVPIKYKIRFLKSYGTFVIQKSYGVRPFFLQLVKIDLMYP